MKSAAVITICFAASAVYLALMFSSPYTIFDQLVEVDQLFCKDGFYDSDNSTEKWDCHDCQCLTNHTIDESNVCGKEDGKCPCKRNYDNKTCNTCKDEYYDYSDCHDCQCLTNHTIADSNVCDKEDGKCPCKESYDNRTCNRCKDEYYDYSDCLDCKCLTTYTKNNSNICDKEGGQCPCIDDVAGRTCDECKDGYFGYPNCKGL